MISLTPAQRRELRAKAHHLNPVVSISENGLTASVMKEIDVSLKAHELIKIRVYGDNREQREAFLQEICGELGCAAVQSIGKLLVVFRPAPEEKAGATKAAKTTTTRPSRPTTKAPPRAKMAGVSQRLRKPPKGSARPKKSSA